MNHLNAIKFTFFVIIFNFSKNQLLNASFLSSNKNKIFQVSSSDEIQSRTDHGVHSTINHLKYTWTIDQFYLREKEMHAQIYSTTFHAATDDDCVRWQLLFEPCGDDINSVSLFCFLTSESKVDKIKATYSVSILNNAGEELWSAKEQEREFVRGTFGYGWNGLIKKYGLFRTKLLQNDALILSFKLSYRNPQECTTNTTNTPREQPQITTTAIPESKPSVECDHCDSPFSDIVLSVNGKNFSAHKAILAAHSDVFEVLIQLAKAKQTKDRDGKILLHVTDMDEEVTGELLRYIYTRKCKNLRKLAKGLLIAADKYILPKLKKICVSTLRKTLSTENAMDLLVFADTHGIDELKNQTIEFIVDKFSEVVNTAAWKNMLSSNNRLIKEVSQAMAS